MNSGASNNSSKTKPQQEQAGQQEREQVPLQLKGEDQKPDASSELEERERQAAELIVSKLRQELILPPEPPQYDKILQCEDNDSGNADKFLAYFHHELTFCKRTQTWFLYDGKRWLEDKNGQEIRHKAEIFYHKVMGIFDRPDLTDKQKERRKDFLRLGNCKVQERLLEAASVRSKFDSKNFNQINYLLVAENGVIDLTKGIPYLFTPNYLLTQKTALFYDMQARKPVRFLRFLKEIFEGNQEMIDYVQKVLGYCLTGETSEQCFFIFCGAGSNGKSVLLNLLQRMLPEYVQTMALSGLAEKRDYSAPNSTLVAAKDARMLFVHELNNNMRLDENFVKTSTGEDKVMARSMYKSEIEFKPHYKLILTVNHFPQVNWDDYAMARRIRLIPFLHTFKGKEIDRQLPVKLWEEREGILRWLVTGAVRWYAENGLGKQPALVQDELWKLEMASPSFCDFHKQCLEVTGNTQDTVQASILYRSYCDWCREQNLETQEIVSNTVFGRNMLRSKITKKMMGKTRCNYYLGVRLKETLAAAEPQEEAEIYGT